MSVETKHPEYTNGREDEWSLVAAAYCGETDIKAAGVKYLPMPSGFTTQADNGQAFYQAYQARSNFPEIFSATIVAMVGIIHEKEIQIDLPEGLEFLRENADGEERTLVDFHRQITRNLLMTARYGVLTDAPEEGGNVYLAGYSAANILNWDTDFFVLDESGPVRNGFAWEEVDQHRVLSIEEGVYTQVIYRDGSETPLQASILGGGSLDRVPFVVAGATDLGLAVETPPLIGVARAAVDIYQLSADWRHQLYMSGQETLVAINGEAPSAVGAGVVHQMMGASEEAAPDLKYVGPACIGIDKHLEAMKDYREVAVQAGARLFEQSNQADESGEARKMRFRSETATLTTIAQSSCACLERALRNAALMMGLNENDVVVTPPADLMDSTLTPAEAGSLMNLYLRGVLSYQTLYERLQRGGIADPDRTFEEEFSQVEDQELEGELA
jgi:hypothetical protein